jgi:TRAP-type transport system periplasmic protein
VNTRTKACAVVAAAISAMSVLHAQGPIKIGSPAPDQSIYVKTLREMGEAWKKRTSGRVTYVVYPGTVGTEEAMIRDMRGSARRLHAAQLSAISLGNMESAFNVFGLPMFFQNYAEADRVLEKLTPLLEQRLEAKGLKALNWGYVGWIHIFSKAPVQTVDELKKQKLFASAGDDSFVKWYRDNGFSAVPLDPTEMLAALKTGMIDAVPAPPLYAQLLNWYSSAPHMMDLGFAPLMGATVMAMESWKRLSPEDQAVVLEEAKKAGERLRREVPKLEEEAIAAMKLKGLKVSAVNSAEWRVAADKLGEAMRRAGLVPGDVYDLAKRERDAVRAAR